MLQLPVLCERERIYHVIPDATGFSARIESRDLSDPDILSVQSGVFTDFTDSPRGVKRFPKSAERRHFGSLMFLIPALRLFPCSG
jgi:hypothetical protein